VDRIHEPQPQPTPTPGDATPAADPGVAYHWIMTIQTSDGRQGTSDGSIDVIPGVHTEDSTYAFVLGEMKKWIGSENTTVLFYRLSPNALPRPAVTR
jgi:hypothetical protein